MSEKKINVSIIGAGGKMGARVTRNLLKHIDEIELFLLECNKSAADEIESEGLKIWEAPSAVPKSDVIVLAVPDRIIKEVSKEITPQMKKGAAMIILDPASAVANDLVMRNDCTFMVAHPCHPSYFIDQDSHEARNDYFGGMGGKQDIVLALIQGEENVFAAGRKVAKKMFEPVVNSYVMGLRNMAFLEPTLVELLGATCLQAMAETVDEAVRRGISRQAAISFLAGHIYNLSANFLGYLGDTKVSDACQVAMDLGNKYVLRDDWKRIWDDDVLDSVIDTMLHG